MMYINAQVKLIQYNFGFPNSFISHNLRKLRILSCSFAPIAAFQRSSSINQVFFFATILPIISPIIGPNPYPTKTIFQPNSTLHTEIEGECGDE